MKFLGYRHRLPIHKKCHRPSLLRRTQPLMHFVHESEVGMKTLFYLTTLAKVFSTVRLIIRPNRMCDSLRAGRSGDRITEGGGLARFSAPAQTGPGTQPASCTMGTGSFPVIKRPGRGVDHPLSYSADVKERVALHLYSPSGSSWPVLG